MVKRPTFYHPTFGAAYQRFMPIIKSKKSKSYLTLTLTFISLSIFGLFAIRPTLITAISLYKDVGDLQALNIQYENKIGSLIRAQSSYEQIRDDLPLIDAAIPTNTDFSKLARSIENFANKENLIINQMQIDNVSISHLPSTGRLSNYGFNMIATGDFNSITNFLTHLINWRRIVNISSLELSHEGGTQSANLRMQIRAITYYEP
ncbi:type 4a pilus biogenesis protein PilO [Patescibacteria group bacterium]|nr:type 4a pilus biogenesis protein PilO [Patescibacteria group bacterium]MCL5797940.1 type 4a pilus biogenesis protein PilO [Patescibacteria group bacterium]